MPDPLRLLVGELAAAGGRDHRPDGPAALLHQARPRRASSRRRSAQDHRRLQRLPGRRCRDDR